MDHSIWMPDPPPQLRRPCYCRLYALFVITLMLLLSSNKCIYIYQTIIEGPKYLFIQIIISEKVYTLYYI